MTVFTLRPALPDDLPVIISLNDAAFEGPDEGRIVETLVEDDASLLSLVAEAQDQTIIGHIQFFPIEVINTTEHSDFAGLGPMSVHPDWQRRGIGSALIRDGLSRLTTLGIQRVFVLGHPDYYPKFGFSVDLTAGFAAPWGGPAFMAIRLNPGGPDFGELVYPEAFAD